MEIKNTHLKTEGQSMRPNYAIVSYVKRKIWLSSDILIRITCLINGIEVNIPAMSGIVFFLNDSYYNILGSFLSVIPGIYKYTCSNITCTHFGIDFRCFSIYFILKFANNENLLINKCNFIEKMFVYIITFYDCN